jgi:thioredoxin reductase
LVANIKKYPPQLWHSPIQELVYEDLSPASGKQFPTNNEVVTYYEDYFKRHKYEYVHEEIINITKTSDGHGQLMIACASGRVMTSRIVVICAGIFESKNYLSIPSVHAPYVRYGYPDDYTLKGKKLVVYGGGNSSVDYINHFLPNNSIIWIMRGDITTHIPPLQKNLFLRNQIAYGHQLTIYNNTTITEFTEDSVMLSNNATIKDMYQCNIFIGFNGKNSLIEKMGVELNNCNNPILKSNFETNIDNVFLYGACSDPIKFAINNWIKPGSITALTDSLNLRFMLGF